MACRFSELVLDCREPEAMAAFWAAVLDYVVLGREDDGSIEIGPPSGFGGAVPADVGQSGDEGWHVPADPEGNPFCLLRRRLAPL